MKKKGQFSELHEDLFLQVSQSCSLLQKAATKLLHPLGITPTQYNLLRIIENTPNVNAREIKNRVYATASSMSQALDKLFIKGFILKKKDKEDARMYGIVLSKDGECIIKKAKDILRKESKCLGIPHSSIQSLIKNLDSINQSLTSSHLF